MIAAPAADELLVPGAEVEWLGSGYGAFAEGGAMLGVAEGPTRLYDAGALVFADSGNGIRYQHTDADGVTVDSWSVAGACLDTDTDRVLVTMPADRPDHLDGMRLDALGNIWCTGPGGIWALAPNGTHIVTLELPRVPVTNFCFGGADLRTIYFTTFTELGRVRLGVPGLDPGRETVLYEGPGWTAEGRE